MKKQGIGRNVLYSAIVGLAGLVYSSFYTMSDKMALSFGEAALNAGFFVAAYALGAFCGNLLWGWLADRHGKQNIIRLALVLALAGLFIAGLAAAKPVTLSALFLMGTGVSAMETMSSAYLADQNPGADTRWMNISQICFCLGAIAAPVATVWYYTRPGRHFREVFLILAVFVVLLLAMALRAQTPKPVAPAATEEKKGGNPARLLCNPRFLLVCLMIFCYIGYECLVITYLKQLFIQRGFGETAAASAVSLFWMCMIAMRIVGAVVNGKEIAGIYIFGCTLLAGIAILLLFRVSWAAFLGAALIGAGCGPVWSGLFVLGGRENPGRSGAAFSVMAIFSTAAGFICPVVFGSWVGNLEVTFIICAALGLLLMGLCACLVVLQKRGRQPLPAGEKCDDPACPNRQGQGEKLL